jgi:hypothetical protein
MMLACDTATAAWARFVIRAVSSSSKLGAVIPHDSRIAHDLTKQLSGTTNLAPYRRPLLQASSWPFSCRH